jgi:HprK-related kinase A
MIHSAVIEKNGQAVILAAPPGSGKSTLCAGLVSRGWRLLSDEMALVDRKTGGIVPVPRPISLKDESIEIMRNFQADAVIGPLSKDTSKGTVAHLRPPVDSVKRDMESVKARYIIFPKYQRGAPTSLTARSKAKSCISLANNCFNYHILGEAGFHLLGELINDSDCFEFCYSQLEEAIPVFDAFVSN